MNTHRAIPAAIAAALLVPILASCSTPRTHTRNPGPDPKVVYQKYEKYEPMEAHPAPEKAEKAAPPSPWNFDLTVYIWLPALDVESTVQGQGIDLEMGFSDTLKESLEFAFAGRLESWHRNLGAILDVELLNLGAGLTVKGGGPIGVTRESDAEIDGTNVFLGGAWRFAGDLVETRARRPGFYGDLIAGVRWYTLSVEVERQSGSKLEGDDAFVEPVIGLRGGYDFCRAFSLSARAEAGGFGIGDLPDHDILLLMRGHFHVAKWLDIDVGYQWKWFDLPVNADNDDFGIEITYNGPWLGVTFLF